jgi:hypothetical protein
VTRPLPRFVVAKPLADDRLGFYFYITAYYRRLGCTIANEPLGADYVVACGFDGKGGRAAAAVVCFEWLQRPENVLGGYVTWSDYRSKDHPNAIKILHHKTGAVVWHPLEETTEAGPVRFYEEAEAVLARSPRRGVPMVLKPAHGANPAGPYTAMTMAKVVVKIRGKLGLPSTFTLDACRHGGMTELEEAELTDGQGRALSGHRSQRA